jgi:hypothetical protein
MIDNTSPSAIPGQICRDIRDSILRIYVNDPSQHRYRNNTINLQILRQGVNNHFIDVSLWRHITSKSPGEQSAPA